MKIIPKKLALYPEGRCFDITSIAYAFVKNNLDLPEFTILSRYLKEGGVFKMIWGCVDLELQTALQIGGYYVDISSDTVDWTDDKLTVSIFPESDFYELLHFRDYARIIELYHDCKVYRNDCLLECALFFPFFIVKNKTSKLYINTNHHLALNNCEQNFIPVSELEYLPVLPENIREQLKTHLLPNSNNLLSYKLFTQSDLLKRVDKLLNLTQEQKLVSLALATNLVNFLNFTFDSSHRKKTNTRSVLNLKVNH